MIESGVDESHIVEMAFDLFDNIDYRNPRVFYPWAKEQLKDEGNYYFLLDEVQLLDEFVSVLNGLSDQKNCDVYVTGSNAKFLSRDIATEFGGRGDAVHMYPLSFSEFMTVYEGNRYDIKGKSYIGTPLKYYFMDMGLRNARIRFRQNEVTHSMENVIYNELRMRGFHVDVGKLTIAERGRNDKFVKKQLEVDYICNKGFKKYYIQSAYTLSTKEKMAQEIRPFLKIKDSFKKIVVTSDTPKPFYTEEGILMMNVYDFLLKKDSLEL